MTRQVLTHGSFCSGIDGFGLGLRQAGIETIFCVEKDAMCQSVLKRHYPDTPLFDDIATCGRHNLPRADMRGAIHCFRASQS